MTDRTKKTHGKSSDTIGERADQIGEIFKAGWSGLSGKEKTTYSDVLKDAGMGSKGRGTLGFALDVGLDPTTYIGVGAIKGGIKLGSKLTGKKGAAATAAFLDKGKNAKLAEEARIAEANKVNPADIKMSPEAMARMAPKGPTTDLKLPDNIGAPAAKAPAPTEVINPVVEKPTKVANTAPVEPKMPNLDLSIPVMGGTKTISEPLNPKALSSAFKADSRVPNKARTSGILTAGAAKAKIEKEIESLRPNRYAPDTAVEAPFKTTKVVPNARKPLTPGQIEHYSYKIAALSDDTLDIPRREGGSIKLGKLKEFLAKAKAANDEPKIKKFKADLHYGVDRIMRDPKIRAVLDREPGATGQDDALAAVRIFNQYGSPMGSHTPQSLARLLKGEDKLKSQVSAKGEIDPRVFGIDPDDVSKLHVNNEDGPISLQGLMDSVQGITRDPETGKVVKAGRAVNKIERLSADEMAAWVEQAHKVMDPADLAPIMAAKTPAQFKAAVAKVVKTKKVEGDFEAPPELAEALSKANAALERAHSEPEWLTKLDEAKTPEAVERVNAAAAVPSTPEIIEEVAEKGPGIFDKPVVNLTAEQSAGVEEALKHFIGRDMMAPLLGRNGEYKPQFTTRGGTKRTAGKLNEGLGRNLNQFNEYSQGASVANIIMQHAAKMLTPAEMKLTDEARGAAIRQHAEPMMDAAWAALDARGILSVGGMSDKNIPLALPDIIKQFPDEITNKYFYDKGRQILPSVWVKIANLMIENPGSEKLVEMVETTLKSKVGRSNGGVDNPLVAVGESRTARLSRNNQDVNAAMKQNPKADRAEVTKKLIDERVSKAVKAMTAPDVVARVVEAQNVSAARYGIESGARITSIEQGTVDFIRQAMDDPNVSPAELMRRLLGGDNIVAKDLAKQVEARPGELDKAKANVEAHVKEMLPADDLAEVKAVTKTTEALKPENWGKGSFKSPVEAERFKTIETRREAAVRNAEQTKQAEGDFIDIDDALELRMHNRAARIAFGVGHKFSTHIENSTLRPEEWANQSMYMGLARDFNNRLASLHEMAGKTFGADRSIKLQEAFKAFQSGGEVDEATKPLLDELTRMGNFMDGIAERGGFRAEDLNDFMDKNGIKKHSFKPFTEQSAMDQFKAFEDVEDPLDFMSKLQKSMGDASTYSAVADSFSSLGSKSPGPGLARVFNRRGDSRIYTMIDKDLYYPKELISQLAVMRNLEEQLAKYSKWDSSKPMRLFDRLTRGWKTGMTVIRPGHHARNLFSDVVLTSLDNVVDPRVYQDATRILAKHKGNIKGDTELAYLTSMVSELPDEIKGITNTRVGNLDVGDEAIYNLAFRQGLFPGYQLLEDLTTGAKGAERAGGQASKGGLIRRAVDTGGRVSEWESNYTRMAHFVGAIKQEAAKIKTGGMTDRQVLDLAAKRAADRVKKFHPDGSDLTGFERGVMRRASMFYSWNRKAIPLIAQTALMNPGKVMVLPKASYNLAVSMGVDPESMSNPFPTDQLFPEYITASMTGPQFRLGGKYFRTEPGDPFAETMGDWGGVTADGPQAGLTALGTLNPIIRIPIEVMARHKFATNSPMQDKSDYIDSQIPGINTLSSLTNRSITGLGAPKANIVKGYDDNGAKVLDDNPGFKWPLGY